MKKKILSVILVSILTLTLLTTFVACDWFNKSEQVEDEGKKTETVDNTVITNAESHRMTVASARLLNSPNDDYGIATLSSTYTLTATIEPSNADNKEVDWEIMWATGGNSNNWTTSDKDVADYVTLTPQYDGALKATLSCSQAFGNSIVVKCTSRYTPSVYATCYVDYRSSVTGVTIKLRGSTLQPIDSRHYAYGSLNFGDNVADFQFTFTQSLGTVYADITDVNVNIAHVTSLCPSSSYNGYSNYGISNSHSTYVQHIEKYGSSYSDMYRFKVGENTGYHADTIEGTSFSWNYLCNASAFWNLIKFGDGASSPNSEVLTKHLALPQDACVCVLLLSYRANGNHYGFDISSYLSAMANTSVTAPEYMTGCYGLSSDLTALKTDVSNINLNQSSIIF